MFKVMIAIAVANHGNDDHNGDECNYGNRYDDDCNSDIDKAPWQIVGRRILAATLHVGPLWTAFSATQLQGQ